MHILKSIARNIGFCSSLIFCSISCFAESMDINGPSPWPEIRKQRISQLLPLAMQAAKVDSWLILCRENNNDPLAEHIGCENAGSPAAFLFYTDDQGFHSLVFSPSSEATALDDLDIHDKVIAVPRGQSTLKQASEFIKQADFSSIAINSSQTNAQADGLSATQYKQLISYLDDTFVKRLVTSEEIVYHWLSVKLPQEVDILRKAAELSAQWQLEAYQIIQPGKTTDAEVAKFLKRKMAEHGVTDGWAPEQNPNVNSGPDRGHSHPTNKIIMPGDVIQIDFGIRLFDRWVSDIQRFGYVLKPGESKAPSDIQHYWNSGRDGGHAAFSAMRPGVRGIDVDAAQSVLMNKNKSEPVIWSTGHPVGYVAHDTGPNLGGSRSPTVRPSSQKTLKQGMVFAFDGFHSWKLNEQDLKTISVEEMAVITADGAEYLIPPQQEIILVGSK
ncbi:M24 family metallopeptidase [Aliiglaciecola sp. LCG003]|uniref:M24 family metallopeptidase n=1 Tax=Aliiglaciecola sp. LCG003 TaxID=3053655 RepID=UPI00257417A4|nr:M24 family metallopeptidase [Aliiglaciecola sp. LCG003]WJG07771.1 M24 family metallopeptidase [Aliiglaciecola sp. LCG003]